jgi:hypothetical protein
MLNPAPHYAETSTFTPFLEKADANRSCANVGFFDYGVVMVCFP